MHNIFEEAMKRRPKANWERIIMRTLLYVALLWSCVRAYAIWESGMGGEQPKTRVAIVFVVAVAGLATSTRPD